MDDQPVRYARQSRKPAETRERRIVRQDQTFVDGRQAFQAVQAGQRVIVLHAQQPIDRSQAV